MERNPTTQSSSARKLWQLQPLSRFNRFTLRKQIRKFRIDDFLVRYVRQNRAPEIASKISCALKISTLPTRIYCWKTCRLSKVFERRLMMRLDNAFMLRNRRNKTNIYNDLITPVNSLFYRFCLTHGFNLNILWGKRANCRRKIPALLFLLRLGT